MFGDGESKTLEAELNVFLQHSQTIFMHFLLNLLSSAKIMFGFSLIGTMRFWETETVKFTKICPTLSEFFYKAEAQ